MKSKFLTINDVIDFANVQLGVTCEYLWSKFPNYFILRHPNGKWFAVAMSVEKSKLGLDSTEQTDILVIKCDPLIKGALLSQKGFLPAYHMNKEHWITILLDGSAEMDLALNLLYMSYEISGKRKKV